MEITPSITLAQRHHVIALHARTVISVFLSTNGTPTAVGVSLDSMALTVTEKEEPAVTSNAPTLRPKMVITSSTLMDMVKCNLSESTVI